MVNDKELPSIAGRILIRVTIFKYKYSLSSWCIRIFLTLVIKKQGLGSWLALEGLAVLSAAQRSLSLLGGAATHASIKSDYF